MVIVLSRLVRRNIESFFFESSEFSSWYELIYSLRRYLLSNLQPIFMTKETEFWKLKLKWSFLLLLQVLYLRIRSVPRKEELALTIDTRHVTLVTRDIFVMVTATVSAVFIARQLVKLKRNLTQPAIRGKVQIFEKWNQRGLTLLLTTFKIE